MKRKTIVLSIVLKTISNHYTKQTKKLTENELKTNWNRTENDLKPNLKRTKNKLKTNWKRTENDLKTNWKWTKNELKQLAMLRSTNDTWTLTFQMINKAKPRVFYVIACMFF